MNTGLVTEDSVNDDVFARLERFIVGWNTAHVQHDVDEEKWEGFFGEWRRCTPQAVKAQASVSSVSISALSDFGNFAAMFSCAFHEYRGSGALFNVWRASQLASDERRNCRVLATLLDHSGEHGQGTGLFCRLLSTIGLWDFKTLAAEGRYYTRTEVWPLDDSESRVDIEIESDDFLIFIEAKITADEQGDQLQRYFELAQCKAVRRKWVVIYLTTDGRNPADHTLRDSGRIKPASWSQVSHAVRSFTLDRPDSPVRDRLFQYAEFVGALR
jgi:hypothetical protein